MASSTSDSISRAKHARTLFSNRGAVPSGLLRDPIERSWKRCLDAGLDFGAQPDATPIEGRLLEDIKAQSVNLLNSSMPAMENLYEQIVNTHSMVILSDADGLVLHSLGDADFVDKAHRVLLQPGANWSENHKGTNAIGTALMERAPVMVHGAEHYIARNVFLTCSASPILDPAGHVIGILDVSGDSRSNQSHTMALVRMSVQMIENRLITSQYTGEVALHFHARPEFIGTLCEGIAVFSPDGQFISANRSGLFQLGMDLPELRRHGFATLFDMPFDQLLERARMSHQQPFPMYMRNGLRIFARVQSGSTVVSYARPRSAAELRKPAGSEVRKALLSLEALATGDEQMQSAVTKARKILGRDIPIMIEGESGTGKELFACAFHHSGPRAKGPFVAVNCAAIPEGLIESELFGYHEGAFTGAKRKGAAGKIQQAHGGTLFLDEIGDMPLNLQARLLRVLQERSVVPLGGAQAVPIDISIVCATNRRLKDEIQKGSFREDLYYRLNGLRITLPPLRTRTDLRELAAWLVDMENDSGRKIRISPDVMALFQRHPWPGNIRQLSNVIRTALALLDEDGAVIERDHLPEDFLEDIEDLGAAQPAPQIAAGAAIGISDEKLEELEIRAIRKALDDNDGNISAAARQLGISRNTLYRKLGRL